MSGTAEVLAVVLLVFFLIGAGVGVVVVIAMSARRVDTADRWHRGAGVPEAAYPSEGEDEDETEPDDNEPNEPGWWPSRGGA
jgi:hypothetical protein